ncbi:MAG: 2-hydroxychromene-2-carboxylate isomerase [Rhodobiaceae bacterium]|nr:2-hydroxychromene-2-carboxylate isomerase [Rhodobiaceae bacterium]
MNKSITYYFSMVSPWAYIGHRHFMEVAARHGLKVDYHPMDLLAVFGETGGVPLAKRHPSRLDYRSVELQRWRAERGLAFNLKPRFFPFNASLADRLVIAQCEHGEDPEPFIAAGFDAIWNQDRDLADEAVLRELLRACGRDADGLLALAGSEEVVARYDAYTAEAVAAGVYGSPCYVFNGEHFWGQDRIDLLDRTIASGRAPFVPAR